MGNIDLKIKAINGVLSPQNSKIGTAVFQVQAEDPDDPNTPNGKIVYSFLDDGSDNGVFEIGETFSPSAPSLLFSFSLFLALDVLAH